MEKSRFMNYLYLSLFLFFINPLQTFASDNGDFVVNEFVFDNNMLDNKETHIPVRSGHILFSRYVGLTDSAKVELCDENGVVATSALQAYKREVSFDFGKDYNLPKGSRFWLVLAKGSVYKLTTHELVTDEIRKEYSVMDSFAESSVMEFPKKMKSLQAGQLSFNMSVMKKTDAAMLLYRDGILVEKCNTRIDFFDGSGYLVWDFGKEVFLDKGIHYKFILPAGSVASSHRADIMNREVCFEVIGLGEDSSVGYENDFVLKDFTFAYNFRDDVVTDIPVKSGSLVFSEPVGVTDNAKVEVRDENGVVATSSLTADGRKVSYDFGDNCYITAGKPFWLVLVEGSVYQQSAPENVVGEVKKKYYVMDSFVNNYAQEAFPEITPSLSDGRMLFDLMLEKKDGARIMLYRNDMLVETCDFTINNFSGTSVLCWDFGKVVTLDKGVRYRFVLPAGSVSSAYRSDIQNREISYDVLANSSTSVADLHTVATATVSCRNGVLSVSGAGHNALVEVFNTNGTLVQRCVAEHGSVQTMLPGKGCYVVSVGGKKSKILNW